MFRLFTYPLNMLAIFAINIYKRTKVRSYDKCLHYPSCSQYGLLAYKKYNFFKATYLTVNRIRNCHPFSNRPYIDNP